MTSINAIRFDFHSGAMVCDEQRHWNNERMKIYAADKIRSIIPERIRERYGIAAAYGNTGTSSIGDELRMTIYREIEKEYDRRCIDAGTEPERFMTIEEIARFAWSIICRVKHTHVDEGLLKKFGFSAREFIASHYQRQGRSYPISNDTVTREALDMIASHPSKPAQDAVFGNAGIVAGFDPETGFRIYSFSMSLGIFEPVESGYVALGSGGDTTNFVLPRLFNRTGVEGRMSGIDRVEGIHAVIDAVNMATEHNLGVGGYFNILLFDRAGRRPNGLYREINDHRSKLASETVRAHRAGFIPKSGCLEILDGLIFQDRDAVWAEEKLFASSSHALGMHRLLRGYPVTADDFV